ncbi:MAG: protein-S-isoprenylcysteine O-methyltransferase Ste14 [Candidatus Paceibacteria bacterium]|jgi:protein-S-isoprenylcysteine O-methyltransferase Ste14
MKRTLEIALLMVAWVAFFLPLIWMWSPIFPFAEFVLRPGPLLAGSSCLACGLWLFYRSHADLGTNWSITLDVREDHQLVTQGIYSRVRHPMYSALLLYSAGQALVLPNYVVGPSYGVAMVLLIALRLSPEERMMHETLGDEYEEYMARSKHIIPGIW